MNIQYGTRLVALWIPDSCLPPAGIVAGCTRLSLLCRYGSSTDSLAHSHPLTQRTHTALLISEACLVVRVYIWRSSNREQGEHPVFQALCPDLIRDIRYQHTQNTPRNLPRSFHTRCAPNKKERGHRPDHPTLPSARPGDPAGGDSSLHSAATQPIWRHCLVLRGRCSWLATTDDDASRTQLVRHGEDKKSALSRFLAMLLHRFLLPTGYRPLERTG